MNPSTVLAIETDSAWAVILSVSVVTLIAALVLRRVIGAPGGLASGILLSLPLAVPLLAALVHAHAALPEISVWQPIGHTLRETSGDLMHLLLVADERSGVVTPYASTGSAGRWVLLVGLSVSSLMLLRRLIGSLVVYRLTLRAHTLSEEDAPGISAAVAHLSGQAGLHEPPSVLVLERGATGAFALGMRRKRILLSRDVVEALDPDELEATLAHEIAHLQARDVPVVFAAGLMRDLMAWNPIGHLAFRRLLRDREFEADRRAASMTSRPLAVASGLLKMRELLKTSGRPSRFAVSFLSERGGVGDRVSSLLAAADGRVALTSAGFLPYAFAGLLVAVLGLQVGARVAQETPAVVITWDGPEAAGRTWSPDESRALRGGRPSPPRPNRREVDQVRPQRYFAPAIGASVRKRDVPEWFAAMDRWTKRQRAEFIRMRWRSRRSWEATPFSRFSSFDIYRVVPYRF